MITVQTKPAMTLMAMMNAACLLVILLERVATMIPRINPMGGIDTATMYARTTSRWSLALWIRAPAPFREAESGPPRWMWELERDEARIRDISAAIVDPAWRFPCGPQSSAPRR
jgi:hypothetical protein